MKNRFYRKALTFLPFLTQETQVRCDSIAFARAFEHVEKTLLEAEFEKLKSEELIDYDTSAPDGTQVIIHRLVTQLGQADFVDHYADDLPAFDVKAEEFPVKTVLFGGHYFWTVEELDQVAMDPDAVRLDTERKKSAGAAMRRFHDKMAAIGSPRHGATGFVNSPYVPKVTPITGGFNLEDTTNDEIIADIQHLLRAVEINSGQNAYATHLAVDPGTWAILGRPFGDSKDYTIKRWLLDNEDNLKEIVQWNYLATAGDDGGPRIVAWNKSKETVKYNAVIIYKELAPQLKNLKATVPVYAKTGFTEWRKPLYGAYMDGVYEAPEE